jgi:glycosyltransferase involved in cell wall biosynthesis
VSDVNALKEMVIDQVNGVYFEADNQEAFEEAVISVLNNDSIGESAREWVVDNRDWSVLLKKLVKVYEKLDIKAN